MKTFVKYQNLRRSLEYTEDQLAYIEQLKPLQGDEWDLNEAKMLAIKETIRIQLEEIQDKYCIYCGRHIDLLGQYLERDHIAPKNARKYPEFMFEPFNIVLACHGCNGSSKKGQMDTISQYNDCYNVCQFKIIHPYFDVFDQHIEYSINEKSIVLKYKTEKGKETISTFDLNNEMLATLRGKDIMIDSIPLTEIGEERIKEILSRQYTT